MVIIGCVERIASVTMLRFVGRDVSAAQQRVGVISVIREDGNSNSSAKLDRRAVNIEWMLERPQERFGYLARGFPGRARHQQGELPTTKIGERRAVSERGQPALLHLPKQDRPGPSTDRFVDVRESIEVEHQQRQSRGTFASARGGVLQSEVVRV